MGARLFSSRRNASGYSFEVWFWGKWYNR